MKRANSEIIIAYELTGAVQQVKESMKTMGYYEGFHFNDAPARTYFLPKNTLWHASSDSDRAMADLKKVCLQLGVKIIRAIAVRAHDFVAHTGDEEENLLRVDFLN